MTRRELIAAFAAAPLAGQRIDYREYGRCLPDYLTALAAQARAKRQAETAKLTSKAAIEARKQWARDTFWKLVGGMPERTELSLRKTGEFQRPDYKVEKIAYESRPGFVVPANLYIPTKGKAPFPGVLFQMGHSRNGKAADSYQRCCQGLAKLGYIVLAFDPMGQGERVYYPGRDGNTRLSSPDEEHSRPGRQMLLAGGNIAQVQVWDAIRSLDVLAAHPMVDPKKLASTGQSGGGTLTMMLAATDDRLACAAVCSGNTENMAAADFHPPGPTDDAEQDWPGAGPLGWDRWDLLYPIIPKPLLIAASAKDFFGTYSPSYLSDGREEFRKLSAIYERLGEPGHIRWVETPQPHGLSYFLRVQVYDWFERFLKRSNTKITVEPEVKPETDETLLVASSGSVVREYRSKTPLDVIRARASEIHTPDKPVDLRELLGMQAFPAKLTKISSVPSAACEVEAIEVQSAERVWAPAWRFVPRQRGNRLLIIADAAGRNSAWHEGELCQELAARGVDVCAVDVRGIGDLRPEVSRGAESYTGSHASEEDYAWASLVFGHSLLGQRVTDLLAFVATAARGTRIAMAARGRMCIPALFAAAIDSRIEAVHLSGMVASYRSVLEAEDYRETLANFSFDVLRHTDLPQLARAIAPRAVSLAAVTDGAGRRLPAGQVREFYGPGTTITEEAAWDVAALSRF